jgi:hypothetical protein
VLTTEEHSVTESAFSPDGKRIAFHDETPGAGGLYVIDVTGTRLKVRVTTDGEDTTPSWIDDEHLVYSHPEKGVSRGRVYMVAAAGGEPVALPKVPGVFLGAIPSRKALLLGIRSPSGDRFAEATLDGKVKDLPLRGLLPNMHWQVMTSVSPSGRYAAWFAGAAAWVANFDAGTASSIDFHWPRPAADMIQADDQGRITVSFRYGEGQLYRVRGSFP